MVTEAKTPDTVVAEAKEQETPSMPPQPVGPTVAELEAKLEALETKYAKEVGDKDRGNARLAGEIGKLKTALTSLARRQFGEEELPSEATELQLWLDQHLPADKAPEPKMTQAQYEAVVAMRTLSEEYGIDYAKIPPELNAVVEEATALFDSDTPAKAITVWRAGLRKFKADNEAKALKKTEEQQAETLKKAKQSQRDTSTSTGGALGSYEAVRDAWMKNPNDPATRAAYYAARAQRGI